VFADKPFTEAFGRRGAPGLPPAVLSLVTVLQFRENLTDRQAAVMAVRAIDWKYAIGAELTDTGFDATVLSRFRTRLAEHGLERVVFDRLLEVCREQGLVGAGGKQRTDSTHVISAVRDLNRTEVAGESVRAALEALAVAAGGWLADAVDVPELAHRYEERVNGWAMPSSKTKRDRLAVVFGQDALALCRAVWAPGAPRWLREIEPVAFLRRMLVQTYYVFTDARGREVIVKRDADKEGVPPGHLRLASPYDPDARWAAKGDDLFWLGYKVHLTETCDTPAEAEAEAEVLPLRLITDVLTTEASVPDVRPPGPSSRTSPTAASHQVSTTSTPATRPRTSSMRPPSGVSPWSPRPSWTTHHRPRPTPASTRAPSASTGRSARPAALKAAPAPAGSPFGSTVATPSSSSSPAPTATPALSRTSAPPPHGAPASSASARRNSTRP
jgi:transposase